MFALIHAIAAQNVNLEIATRQTKAPARRVTTEAVKAQILIEEIRDQASPGGATGEWLQLHDNLLQVDYGTLEAELDRSDLSASVIATEIQRREWAVRHQDSVGKPPNPEEVLSKAEKYLTQISQEAGTLIGWLK